MEETAMRLPLQMTFRHIDASPSIEDRIREYAAELDRFFDQIMWCRVAVERQHRRHHHDNLIRVRLDITVPGREIVVGRDSKPGQSHDNIVVAIRDAFAAARRQIEDHARIHRGEVKLYSLPDYGRIIRLFPKEDYGFIATADSGEVYFHRNSVVGGAFDKLAIGDEVRFVVQYSESARGLQASTVSPVG
jgi:cold shock CspA family protein/ribosome-associated translation inhibitor RaiA